MMTKFRFLLSLTLIALFVGCNSDLPLTGTITYTDDNSPVPMGTVVCYGEGVKYSGTIKADGTYEITNAAKNGKAGLPAGDYTISVTASEQIGVDPNTGSIQYKILVHPKHGDPKTSGFVVTIPHEGPLDLKVERNPNPAR